MRNDFYIKFLKLAIKSPDGFDFREILKNNGFTPLQKKLIEDEFRLQHSPLFQQVTEGSDYTCFLTFRGRMILLEYEQLKQAREYSSKAQQTAIKAIDIATKTFWIAIGALTITALIGIAQIFVSIYW